MGAVADLAISCFLWIATDSDQNPVAIRQASKVYEVLDVIRPTSVHSE